MRRAIRRSTVVRLTLLPMLASAAVAAQPAQQEIDHETPTRRAPRVHHRPAPVQPGPTCRFPQPPPVDPYALRPPGMTPPIWELACEDDPNWELRNDCPVDCDEEPVSVPGGGVVYRGGFGHYFSGGSSGG